jgi:hypothetical protein
MEWSKIKHEYVTTDTSYRKLAAKYHIRLPTLTERAKAERWVDERTQYRNNTYTASLEKSVITDADRIAKQRGLADRILDELSKSVEGASLYELKQISGVIRDLQCIKSDADIEEQAQRIANLRRQAGAEEIEIEDNSFVSAELFPDETAHS